MTVKKKIIYEEDIYFPADFGMMSGKRVGTWLMVGGFLPIHISMPAMLIGWTRNKMHVAFHYQGLQ